MKRPSARRATPFFKKYSSAIVLTSVITVGVIAAAVAQYQRIYQGPLAPTAPQSQPAAAENPVCSIVFEITATPTSTPTPTPTSTPTPTPTPTPSSTPTPTPSNSPTPTPTSTPTPTPSSTPTPSPTPSSTPTPTPSNTPSPTPSATPTPGCNTDCETNADCRANHICYTVSSTSKVCRLAAHPTSIVCAPATPTPTPTSTPTPTPTPTASPIALGCNDNCTRNADCRDSNHICFDTGNNTYKCRLATNPSSDRCEQTVAQATSTPAPALPQAGGTSSTTMSIVIVSAAVVIIGAIGLLLLL